jgi:dihydroflavonol-4-reductase
MAQLLEKNAEIHALVMENDPLADELPREVRTVNGDVCNESSLRLFFSGADRQTCVIHCAGIVSVASHPDDRLSRVNVGGTKNILRFCEESSVGKLVYVSSVHAIPEKPEGMEITEEAVFSPELVKGEYAKSKAIATALVFDAAKRGLNVSVVFPSGIIGPGDSGKGSITTMLLSFLAGKLPVAVKGGYDFVDVRDVASGIIACSEQGMPGRGYILSGNYASIRDILEAAKKTLRLKRAVSYLPICLAKLIAPVYEKFSIRRRKPAFFTPYAVAVLASNASFSRKAAAETFGYSPRSLQSTIKDTVLWLKGIKNSRRK